MSNLSPPGPESPHLYAIVCCSILAERLLFAKVGLFREGGCLAFSAMSVPAPPVRRRSRPTRQPRSHPPAHVQLDAVFLHFCVCLFVLPSLSAAVLVSRLCRQSLVVVAGIGLAAASPPLAFNFALRGGKDGATNYRRGKLKSK